MLLSRPPTVTLKAAPRRPRCTPRPAPAAPAAPRCRRCVQARAVRSAAVRAEGLQLPPGTTNHLPAPSPTPAQSALSSSHRAPPAGPPPARPPHHPGRPQGAAAAAGDAVGARRSARAFRCALGRLAAPGSPRPRRSQPAPWLSARCAHSPSSPSPRPAAASTAPQRRTTPPSSLSC